MRVLFFGTYNATTHPRVAIWKEGFRAHGDEVIELNVPLTLNTAARVRILQKPWLLPLLAVKVVLAWVKLWRMARAAEAPHAVAVGYMGHFDVHLARNLWRNTPIVLDHLVSAADTALDRGVSTDWITRSLAHLDRSAMRAADICCVDTEEHLQLVPADLLSKFTVVPVGATKASFRAPKQSSVGKLRVIFFGNYTPLHGAPVIGKAIDLLDNSSENVAFTMVGSGQDLTSTMAQASSSRRVEWLEWVQPAELPDLLASHDVCLGIFGVGPKAGRVVPNKVFQGAAAGCAIVTSDTAPQRRTLQEDAVYVVPGNPEALAGALSILAGDPARVWSLRVGAYARAQRDFAPAKCVEPLRSALLKNLS